MKTQRFTPALISFTQLRKSKLFKGVMAYTAFSFLSTMFWPNQAMALTSGPSQPEVQSFEPATTTQMVDMFTGDFNYNIPLFNLPGPNGGYPFNLSYHAGIGMDQEASWTGLGWNLNPGVINRGMRGLPDDFDGDVVTTTNHMKPNVTIGVNGSYNFESSGADVGVSLGSIGLTIYNNNYRGVGYGLNGSVGMGLGNSNVRLGLGFNLDSQEGAGANASLSMSHQKKNMYTETFTMSGSLNSKRGLSLNSSYSAQGQSGSYDTPSKMGGIQVKAARANFGTSPLSFSENLHAISVGSPIFGTGLSVNFKLGPSAVGQFPNWAIGGYYNETHLKNNGDKVSHEAYGYENFEKRGDFGLGDYAREKEGLLRETTPNLPIPRLTYDIYTITGQGTGGSYRPHRSDVGQIYDSREYSDHAGGSFGFDISSAATHFGTDFVLSYGYSQNKQWNDTENEWFDEFQFTASNGSDSLYEKVYYKTNGEFVSMPTNEFDRIGGERAIAPKLKKHRFIQYDPELDDAQFGNHYESVNLSNTRNGNDRMPRNQVIQPLTNGQIDEFSGTGDALLGEFEIKYYDMPNGNDALPDLYNDPTDLLNRSTRATKNVGHHNGAISATNANGQRYLYGLPAYNNKHIEAVFSVENQGTTCGPTVELPLDGQNIDYELEGTQEYFNKREIPPYAHSYLLTSILGTDYVDIDGNGPSDADFGYWTKFDYIKYANDYKWRAPFKGALYNPGLATKSDDATGSYQFGEKELWYLGRAETKTHIAIFHTSERNDNLEVTQEMNTLATGSASSTNSGLRLDSISMYYKQDYIDNSEDALPLVTVVFEYDYSLCEDIPNQSSGAGKLTLKSLYIKQQNTSKGELSPYVFTYNETIDVENPDYGENNYDRWGTYKPNPTSDECLNKEFPYVEQMYYDTTRQSYQNRDTLQQNKDLYASVWSLKSIQLPTGGVIKIDYEADDYGYVQHREATQMFRVSSINDDTPDNLIYNSGNPNAINADQRRVYFKLEEPIPASTTLSEAHQEVYDDYVKELRRGPDNELQLYFKINVEFNDAAGFDYVSGYALLEDGTTYTQVDQNAKQYVDINGDGTPIYCYTHGFVTLKRIDKFHGSGQFKYHPFAMAAWQHMRTTDPTLFNNPGGLNLDDSNKTPSQKFAEVMSIATIVPGLISAFKDYRKACQNGGWASALDLSKSNIRLCSPDKKKYGGGHRVKKITMSDEWSESSSGELDSEYGQVYEYTKLEGNRTISSGVAQYEPMIGGDENPMRYAKFYAQNIPFKTDNHLFFEEPVNESYFPAPVVGYSQVTVRSLTTSKIIDGTLPPEVSGTGEVVHEFYTAQDFPTIVEETAIKNKPFKYRRPIPLVGSIDKMNITAAQGYKIELNDMHGRQKAIYSYGLDSEGIRQTNPISSVQRHYKSTPYFYQGKAIRRLDNEVKTIVANHDQIVKANGKYDADFEMKLMGVDYEFVTDQRKHVSEDYKVGGFFNLDEYSGTYLAWVPSFWPTFMWQSRKMRTVATNKIIHKAGIVESVEATDGQAKVTTTNKLWDAQSGQVLLSTVNNNYDEPIYSYSHPAHWEYPGMSAAYASTGLEFTVTNSEFTLDAGNIYEVDGSDIDAAIVGQMHPGDEFIIDGTTNVKGTYLGTNSSGTMKFYLYSAPTGSSYKFFLYRSGKRNQLSATIGNVVALADPTTDRHRDSCASPLNGEKYLYFYNMDSILSVSAVTMSNGWNKDFSEVRSGDFDWWTDYRNDNPYQNGEQGIWLPRYSYAYQDVRQQSDAIDLSIDGIINAVPYFNYQVLAFANTSCGDKWKRVNEIMAYNPYGYDTENKDILGNYTAALYGHEGSVPIAVGANARQSEIGFESFEELTPGSTIDQFGTSTGNIDVYTDHSATSYSLYNVYSFEQGKNTYIDTDLPYDASSFSSPIIIYWSTIPGIEGEVAEHGYETATVTSTTNISGNTRLHFSALEFVGASENIEGKVAIARTIDQPTPSSFSNVDVTADKAHTGNNSLKVTGNARFEQNRLQLEEGRRYELSVWVSQLHERVPTYSDSLYFQINITDDNSVVHATTIADGTPTGPVIEGWQQVVLDFTVPDGATKVEIEINSRTLDDRDAVSFIDDLRIYPLDGNVQTYVYDPVNLRVVATLDQNNYATLYSYDEEGNLFLVKKETERGIFTVQESRGHLIQKPQP